MERSGGGASSDGEVYYSTVSTAPPKRPAGRTKFQETRHPVYKGVRRRNANKWVCEVREPNKKTRIWLGTFSTAEMAARAHDVAAIALRGRSACLNFADSAWLLPSPRSTSPRDIQEAAAKVEELFVPPTPRPVAAEVALPEYSAVMSKEAASSSMEVQNPFYLQEELDFGMQGYWDMAEGLLIKPPAQPTASMFDDEEQIDDGVLPLWSHSI